MKKDLRPTARKEDLVIQETGEELLVYDISTNTAKCLNDTSAYIWRSCDGNRSARDIAREMSRNHKTTVTEDYVAFAFSELSAHGLIDSLDVETGRVSRRDVIKKIGLTSMVALPIVASMVAPSVVHAQSCIANNSTCTASAQCCSMCCKNVGGGVNECKPGGGACLP
jgi:hypothetical protein